MAKMAVPESPELYTTRYENLGGVDYSCDITEVDTRRTPTGLNMISDDGSNPVKRLGWRVIQDLNAGKILKILTKDGEDNRGNEYVMADLWVIAEHGVFYLHHRTDYTFDTGYTVETLFSLPNDVITDCVAFTFIGSLYCILSKRDSLYNVANTYGMYKLLEDGVAIFERVEGTNAYVPETTIGITPNGTGGTSLEAVNILNPKMTFSFLGNDTDRTFYLYPANLRGDDNKKYIVRGTLQVQQLTTTGWTTLAQGTDYSVSGSTTIEGLTFGGSGTAQVLVCDASITFNAAKPPLVAGQDNIRVTFEQWDNTQVEYEGRNVARGLDKEYLNDILSSRAYGIFGHTKPDRVFLAGGMHKNRIYYSQVDKPNYFPDNNYVQVGHDDNDIVTMQRVSDYLAVVKGNTVLDNTMYLIKGSYLDESMYFMVIPTSAVTGAIAPQSASTLIGEPMFLAHTGIFGIGNVYGTTEQTIRNRSRFIDKKLTKEPNLEKACGIVWNKYYVLCVNEHCYVLDGRNVNRQYKYDATYQYEAYYWEGIPAVTFATYQEELFFGTEDGKICKFNTDVSDNTKYCDNGQAVWENGKLKLTATEDTVAIPCEWSTPLDSDKVVQRFKTLNKKGNVVTLLASEGTTAEVTLIKDGVTLKSLDTFTTPFFDWVAASYAPLDITAYDDFAKKKVKKYKRLQIRVQNNGMFEPFGIIGITKTYSVGNFSK